MPARLTCMPFFVTVTWPERGRPARAHPRVSVLEAGQRRRMQRRHVTTHISLYTPRIMAYDRHAIPRKDAQTLYGFDCKR